jgi:putative transposase
MKTDGQMKPNSRVMLGSEEYIFKQILNENEILLTDPSSKSSRIVSIDSVQLAEKGDSSIPLPEGISKEKKEEAEEKLKYVSQLLNGRRKPEDYQRIAESAGVHIATIYEWRKKYLREGLTGLISNKGKARKGAKLLEAETEEVIAASINTVYLTKNQVSIPVVYEEVVTKCHELGIKPPHINTLRSRISEISEYEKTKHRIGLEEAENQFTELKGSLKSDIRHEIVQVDHTLLNIILVDDETRQPIGRAWITLVFDVATRIVLGFYISLDPQAPDQ